MSGAGPKFAHIGLRQKLALKVNSGLTCGNGIGSNARRLDSRVPQIAFTDAAARTSHGVPVGCLQDAVTIPSVSLGAPWDRPSRNSTGKEFPCQAESRRNAAAATGS